MRIKAGKLGLGEARAVAVGPSDQLLALDEALQQLEEKEPRLSRIVDLRFFGDLSEEETGEVLGVSVRTVKRDWSMARAWLYQQIT
jgi:RNA polymerase sigma factor (sigma-70 family)